MTFQKSSPTYRWDFTGNEIVADGFTITGGTPVSSATRQAAIAAVAAVSATNAGTTYTTAEQTLINSLKTQLNALIAALQT